MFQEYTTKVNANTFKHPDPSSKGPTPDPEIEHKLRLLELNTRLSFLERIERAARRYVGCCSGGGKRDGKHRRYKDARNNLVEALALFEELEASRWRGDE